MVPLLLFKESFVRYRIFLDEIYFASALNACEIFIGLYNEDPEPLRRSLAPEIEAIYGKPMPVITENISNMVIDAVAFMTRGPKFDLKQSKQFAELKSVLEALQARTPSGDRDLPLRIEIDSDAARTFIGALESHFRFASGQFKIAMEFFEHDLICSYEEFREGIRMRDKAMMIEGPYKELLQLSGSKGFGLGQPQMAPGTTEAFTLQRTILHRLSWDKCPEGHWSYPWDKPSHYGSSPFMPKIEKITEDGA